MATDLHAYNRLGKNTLAYWPISQAAKKSKCCDFGTACFVKHRLGKTL